MQNKITGNIQIWKISLIPALQNAGTQFSQVGDQVIISGMGLFAKELKQRGYKVIDVEEI